jgi:hypothetical protein
MPFRILSVGRISRVGRRRQASLALASVDQALSKQVLYQGSGKISGRSYAGPSENEHGKGTRSPKSP